MTVVFTVRARWATVGFTVVRTVIYGGFYRDGEVVKEVNTNLLVDGSGRPGKI